MEKIIKSIIAILVAMLLMSPANASDKSINMYLNGEKLVLRSAPIVKNSRTFIPIRELSEALDMNIDWCPKGRYAIIVNKDMIIKIPLDKDYAYINGKIKKLDSPAFAKNGRTFVPVRFISEEMGLIVDWDGENKDVWLDIENYYIDKDNLLHKNKDCIGKDFEKIGKHYSIFKGYDFCNFCFSDLGNVYKISKKVAKTLDIEHIIRKENNKNILETDYINLSEYPIFNFKLRLNDQGNDRFVTLHKRVMPEELSEYNFLNNIESKSPHEIERVELDLMYEIKKDVYVSIRYDYKEDKITFINIY